MKVTNMWIGALALAAGLGAAGTAPAGNNQRAATAGGAPDAGAFAPAPLPGGLVRTNLGEWQEIVFEGHHLSAAAGGTGILYAPSNDDDPGFRADLSAITGAPVDYFDTRVATPTLALLQQYACVFTWTNSPYLDNVAFGDVLADYVDGAGNVVLGAFCTFRTGFFLAGRIMDEGYCPVFSPDGTNHFADSAYRFDGVTCLYDGIASLTCLHRDFLALQGDGVIDGTYLDGEICHAYRPDGRVVYSNGNTGAFSCSGDFAQAIANACSCLGSQVGCVCNEQYDIGDRVRLVVDNPDGNPDLLAGHGGTVICGNQGFPPLLVLWDEFASGHNGNGLCECPDEPIVLPGRSGWYVGCDEVATACPADVSGNGAVDFADILEILANWGPCN